jgi:hypothetical protein
VAISPFLDQQVDLDLVPCPSFDDCSNPRQTRIA